MRNQFTQGCIIEDIRSSKYANIRCKGIVISARCDIAQRKIPCVHYLTALNIYDWMYEVLFETIVDEMRKKSLDTIKNLAKEKELDFETLLELGIEKTETILLSKCASGKKKEMERIQEAVASWKRNEIIKQGEVSREEKKEIFKSYGEKKLFNTIKALYNSNFPKFCFIPEKAYAKSDSAVRGLVVDLQDIQQIDMSMVDRIINFECDYVIIEDETERRTLNRSFFFENKNDFLIIDSIVESPWIEYLLQLFANSFTRIGVDNADEEKIIIHVREFLEASL